MNTALKIALGACAVGIALVVTSARAETVNCTPISALPATISSPGVYCLGSDLSMSQTSGAAIRIDADDVVLDLNGHVLQGTGANQTYGILSEDHTNITVKNGTVREFDTGVLLYSGNTTKGQTCLIEDLRVDGNAYTGIRVMNQGCVVRRNYVMNTGAAPGSAATTSAVGIMVMGRGSRVLDNSILDTYRRRVVAGTAYGIMLYGDGAMVEGNRVMNFTGRGSGIYVTGGAKNVQLVANRIYFFSRGIFFRAGSSGDYRDNLTIRVTTPFSGGTNSGGNN